MKRSYEYFKIVNIQLLNKIMHKILRILVQMKINIFLSGCKKKGKGIKLSFPMKIHGKSSIEIGDYVSINAFVHIWGQGGVKIGNRVMIASNTSISSLSHNYHEQIMRFAPIIAKPVIIEDDVWICSNSVINPGIRIGEGAVIGAGAVVTKDVPPNAIMVGVPAKILKYRQQNIISI